MARLTGRRWIRDEEFRRLAGERAALQRLATLIASGGSPDETLDAVACEMGRVLNARYAILARYETDGTVTSVGTWNYTGFLVRGTRWAIEKGTALEVVWRTGAPGRVDVYEGEGHMVTQLRDRGFTTSVGCPITVGRTLWGVAIISNSGPDRFPPDTEQRMQTFTELASASIASAQSDAELRASRARIVTAADASRRRIERDLHDGTQQRLITIGLDLRAIEEIVADGPPELQDRLAQVIHSVQDTIDDLQEISRGLHPAILSKGGLTQALTRLAGRSPLEVDLRLALGRRLPESVEATVYYLVSEALSNVGKHARVDRVAVGAALDGDRVRVRIRDEGVGGADPACGSGLTGLSDRVAALGGRLVISSPAGHGTSLEAEVPTDLG